MLERHYYFGANPTPPAFAPAHTLFTPPERDHDVLASSFNNRRVHSNQEVVVVAALELLTIMRRRLESFVDKVSIGV
jgi:hypothetical protein